MGELLDEVEDDAGVLVAQVEAIFLELAREVRELFLRLVDFRDQTVELVVLGVDLVAGVDELAFQLVYFLVSKRYCFVGREVFAFSLGLLFLAFETLFQHPDLRLLRLQFALAQDALLLDLRPRLLQAAS